ncbi:MAG TPA: transposase [Thiobacillus sp.]|nr:transposase [Thiobacillus sp.]
MLSDIRRVRLVHRDPYGANKTWLQALNEAGAACGKHRVARLRREAGIVAKSEVRPGDGRASSDAASGV